MTRTVCVLLAMAGALAADAPVRYTGTVVAWHEGILEIKRLDGKPVRFEYSDAAGFNPGDGVEVEASKSNGRLIARRVVPRAIDASRSDPLWESAIEEAAEYGRFLPNFTCRQNVRRSRSESRRLPPGQVGTFSDVPHPSPRVAKSGFSFRQVDTLTVDVAYIAGKEHYSNHRQGRRRISAAQAEATGSWSIGEYGSTLLEVVRNAAAYRSVSDSVAAGREVRLYQAEVREAESGWQVSHEGRAVRPHYKGSVWVDMNSAQVLGIELRSVSMPADFAIRKAEWVVDFASVPLARDYFLLPVAAANVVCWRFEPDCSLNEIRFEDYRRFSSESTVYTTESTIEFEKGKAAKTK